VLTNSHRIDLEQCGGARPSALELNLTINEQSRVVVIIFGRAASLKVDSHVWNVGPAPPKCRALLIAISVALCLTICHQNWSMCERAEPSQEP
jgi:hypothetical protein